MPVLDGIAQAGDPLQLALMFEQHAIIRVELLHLIAPHLFSQLAGAVCPAQCGFPIADIVVQFQQANTGLNPERPPLPTKDKLLNTVAQSFSLRQRRFSGDAPQQHGKLIAANAGQLGLGRQMMLQVIGYLAQQLIARNVPLEVVDLFELVKVNTE